jgi:hypothetical protein
MQPTTYSTLCGHPTLSVPGGVGQQTKFMAAQLGYNIIGEGCYTPSVRAREYCSF